MCMSCYFISFNITFFREVSLGSFAARFIIGEPFIREAGSNLGFFFFSFWGGVGVSPFFLPP